MRTAAQRRWDLRRALSKRAGSAKGWRWTRKPTQLEQEAFAALRRIR
jgi:hypothetical protein